jgi:hypothetical protein
MYIWRSTVFVAATLAVGCTGEVAETPMNGGSGSGAVPASPGSGGVGNKPAGAGGANAGATTGVGPSGNAGTPTTPGAGAPSVPGAGAPGTGGPGAPPNANCTPTIPPTSQIPRLTNQQYDRTVRDLLGVTNLKAAGGVAPSTRLATDQAAGLTDLAWANYKDVADKIATEVIADPALKTKFMKCTPAAGDTACFRSTIVEFGRRAFRRPLSDLEIARFEKVVAAGKDITATGTPDEIAQTLLYMFLISPSFLQRAEMAEVSDGAGHFTLTNHEIASRLAYLLWGTMPDAALDQAADQGMLSTPEQVSAQADRMLKDPRARDMVSAFHQSYLVMRAEGRWNTAQKDPAEFPTFKAEAVPALTEETLKFFDKIAFTPGATFKDFFLSPLAFVNKDTAPLYGLDPAKFGAELTETMLDPSQRPGFLTRAGFLANFSSFNRTSPIYRGAFITKDVLGIAVPAPPPGATETPLPSGADLNTTRKQVEEQTSGQNCISCHSTFINPPGFVMEAFDSVGAYRTAEKNGTPLDTTATVTLGDSTVTVSTPAELMAHIAASPGAMRQYAKRWIGFAFARENDPADTCTVDQIAAKMAIADYTVLKLITDLTQTQPFRVRAVEVTP